MSPDLKAQLQSLIEKSLKDFPTPSQHPFSVALEIPSEKQHGDFSCTIALKLAGILKKSPLEIADSLKDSIEKNLSSSPLKEKIKTVEVKKPGFINFFLADAAFYEILEVVLQKKGDYGKSKEGKGKKVQIEFVSANPTGPLSVAHARQAAVGGALANILKFASFEVKKEFYVNDEGNQINILGRSIECRAKEILGEAVDFPEDGYQGDYIRDMARQFLEDNKIKDLRSLAKKDLKDFLQFGVDYLLNVIKNELKDFGVQFDVWSHQSKIANEKNIAETLDILRKKDFVYEKDGALWFKSTAFGDDKDRVVKKSDGSFTYLAPDIVYHKDKFERGFHKVINIWGPDHHGYIPRIKAAVAALGYDISALEVLIVQLATIFRDGKPLSMSTRRGQYISLREVIDEVGVDAARYFFLMRRIEAHLDFDLALAKKQTPENPVYYVQYAHARIHSIFGLARQTKLKVKESDFRRLKEPEEIDLLKKIGSFPAAVAICTAQRDPFPLGSYLLELAILFHKFYDRHRVITEDRDLSAERLALAEATKTVLANGLCLLGVSAPTEM